MAARRFHVEDLSHPTLHITGEPAHHALKVLRLEVGAPVVLFNANGIEADGRIIATTRDSLEIEIIARREIALPIAQLTIACAVPKGDRADWLVEKCAELGVTRLIPLICERSQVRPGEGKIDRWRRKAVEAARQSRQSHAMSLESPKTLAESLTSAAPGASIYFGNPDPANPALHEVLAGSADKQALIIVGPEGGLTADELALIAHSGGRGIRLASSILRIETAAVAIAAIWAAHQTSRPGPSH